MATMNRAEAQIIIEKIRSFGLSDTQLMDALFDNILSGPTAYALAIDLAEEFNVDAVEEDIDIVEEDEEFEFDEYESEHRSDPFGY
jgi:hypothetical protein